MAEIKANPNDVGVTDLHRMSANDGPFSRKSSISFYGGKTMSEEARKEILDLLADGKITAGEAAEMLAAVKAKPAAAEDPEAPQQSPKEETAAPQKMEETVEENGRSGRWLRIRVGQLSTGKRKVSVNIPLRMIKFGLHLADRFAPETAGWRGENLKEMVDAGLTGTLVDVEDELDDEHVRIYIE
jgi:DNA-binding transcriptional ArsR family regulator